MLPNINILFQLKKVLIYLVVVLEKFVNNKNTALKYVQN